ncbi:MAG: DUF1501 domain-containing protein [Pirellulaceae bacterium]
MFNTLSRRELLRTSALGFGSLAFAHMMANSAPASPSPQSPAPSPSPHFPPKAEAVIMLMQNGGPSQMDLFDPKPELTKNNGKTANVETYQLGNSDKLMASPLTFKKYGECGLEMSTLLPHLGSVADELCVIRSMHSEHNNHTEALVLLNTGKIFPGRPALGSWISYGLGTENQNLPAYIVLRDPEGYNTSGTLLWQNGWLPAQFRGTEVSTQGSPVLNLRPQTPLAPAVQKENLDLLARLNEEHRRSYPLDGELETRIRNYELAARMQLAAGDILDLSKETQETQKLYGLDNTETAGYGLRCLMARRLVESGVRFVQVFPPVKPQNQPWDAHGNVKTDNEKICLKCDQPSAALISDLKRRGLLDKTLVLWSGEFGRLPVSQNGTGRDHNRNAFTLLAAGGGFRRGYVHGATDEVGYRAVDKRVSVPDLHATVLQQLGLDHNKLTWLHAGIDETLTDSRVTGAKVQPDLVG